jgi:hypothetical protein
MTSYISITKRLVIVFSHWLVCLGFRLPCAELSGSGGDALGVSGRDAGAEDSAVGRLLGRVNHAVLAFVHGIWLELAIRGRDRHGAHAGRRVLGEERRGRDVMGKVR